MTEKYYENQQIRAYVSQSPLSTQLVKPDGETAYVNAAWEKLWGIKFADLKGYNLLRDPQLQEKGISQFIQKAFNGEASEIPAIAYDPGLTIPSASGKGNLVRWVRGYIYPVKASTGELEAVVLMHEDITEKMLAEQQLERYHLLSEYALDIVLFIGENGQILEANSAATIAYGYERDELLTLNIHDLRAEEAKKDLQQQLSTALASGMSFETLHRRKNGTVFPVDVNSRSAVINNQTVLLSIIRDMTAQKRVQDDLRISEDRYRTIVENTPAAVTLIETTGKLVAINRAGLEMVEAHQASEVLGRSVLDVINTPDSEALLQLHKNIIAGQAQNIQFQITSLKGSHRFMESRAVPVLGSDGNTWQLAITQDVTERRRAEDALKEADRRKDEFLATLAHELRNPLASIGNALGVIVANKNVDVQAQSQSIMTTQLAHIVRLVDDLMDVSRINTGKIELKNETVNIKEVLRGTLQSIDKELKAAGHELKLVIPEETLLVRGDPVRLSQIFFNLISNAVKYTPPGGKISIDFSSNPNEIIFTISDTGVGIERDVLPSIFDMFSQADSTLGRSQGGLGIGLGLVKKLVTLHGGTINARSEGAGQGSVFEVMLPPSQDPLRPESTRVEEKSNPTESANKLRIVIVDDNHASAKTLGWAAEMFGHKVELAHSGKEAIELVKRFVPDVMLLDIGLPEMNGYELCRVLRQNPLLTHTLFVAQTGWGKVEHRQLSQEAGFHHHFVKPVDLKVLENLLIEQAKQT
jgi:PAS domain S-box-containing protein